MVIDQQLQIKNKKIKLEHVFTEKNYCSSVIITTFLKIQNMISSLSADYQH